jgi:hypothetical protein
VRGAFPGGGGFCLHALEQRRHSLMLLLALSERSESKGACPERAKRVEGFTIHCLTPCLESGEALGKDWYNAVMGPQELASAIRARADALARFAEWESSHPAILTPEAAVAAIGALYQLLPPASRQRPVDTRGVARLHDTLRHLSR